MIQGVCETIVGFGARVLKRVLPCPHNVLLEDERLASCEKTQLSLMGVDKLSDSISHHNLHDNCRRESRDEIFFIILTVSGEFRCLQR